MNCQLPNKDPEMNFKNRSFFKTTPSPVEKALPKNND